VHEFEGFPAAGGTIVCRHSLGRGVTEMADVERRLVAIFAADVEGYSRLMGKDEVAGCPYRAPGRDAVF
jgi:hypothetical protein